MTRKIGFRQHQKDILVKYFVNKIDNILINNSLTHAKSFVKHFFELALAKSEISAADHGVPRWGTSE